MGAFSSLSPFVLKMAAKKSIRKIATGNGMRRRAIQSNDLQKLFPLEAITKPQIKYYFTAPPQSLVL